MMPNDVAYTPEPTRPTIRIVGFKVADASPSPTSVMTARSAAESPTSSASSPRSKLAEALRREAFNPLPRLRIKATPRSQGPGFKRSLSHADLQVPERDCSPLATPGSRASTTSTPMRIPSALARVKTCPMQLVDMASLDADVAATLPAAGSGSLQRRASEDPSSDEEVDGATLARDLFAAGAFAGPAADADVAPTTAADVDADAVEAAAPGLGDLQAEMQRLHVQHVAPAPPPRMLRLPAAAMHRRARSEVVVRRTSPPS